MQDQPDSPTSLRSRPTVRDEFFGPPRPTRRAQLSAVTFGLLLVASLVIPAFTDTQAMPGLSLVCLGMLLLLGVAELMDASQQRFIIAVRWGAMAIALLGLVIQLV